MRIIYDLKQEDMVGDELDNFIKRNIRYNSGKGYRF